MAAFSNFAPGFELNSALFQGGAYRPHGTNFSGW